MENEAEKIRDQFVHLRDRLKRKGIDAQQLADLLGVKRQTTYQYGFSPNARGARIVPADLLDKMRVLYTRLHFGSAGRGYPAFLDRRLVEWIYTDANGSVSTTCWKVRRTHCILADIGGHQPGRQFDQLICLQFSFSV